MNLAHIITAALCLLSVNNLAQAKINSKHSLLSTGFSPINFVSPENIVHSVITKEDAAETIAHFCKALEIYFSKYKWEKDPCGAVAWKASLKTHNGHPLIYAEFGDGEETTLLLGGVHPDEYTPVPMAFRFARHLKANPAVYTNKGIKVVIAPLVNPDGFLRNVPTRNNANGVDPNRNFYTMDWYDDAKDKWRFRRDLRHFPGYFPNTEMEAVFQVTLIDDYHPDKILSIHAPLGFLDYDGPGDGRKSLKDEKEKQAKRLVYSISEKSRNYKVVDFTFYPGSLGNYAGNERHIPTVTLEMETIQPDKVDEYWQQFLPGMLQSIKYPFKKKSLHQSDPKENATKFSTHYHNIK